MLRSVHAILLLATLSGVAGIAYEVLYSRLLSTYFGDIFYISAAIVTSFLLSIALGSLVAHRFARYLAYIEIAIGVYALCAALVFTAYAKDLVALTAVIAPSGPLGFVAIVALLLAVPAFLIGFSVPIFSLYVTRLFPQYTTDARGFRHVYLVYNVGAAVAVLAIEFILLRTFGITAALMTAAGINLIIGFILLKVPAPAYRQSGESGAYPPRRAAAALVLASIASGIFQLFVFKIANAIFGPLNENFAIVLAAVFLGIAFASYGIGKYAPPFRSYLLYGSLLVIGTFVFVTPLIYVWAYAQSAFGLALGVSVGIKIILLIVFSIAGFTFFGGTIPLYLKQWPGGDATAGKTLALASLGNAIGFLAVIFVLHEYVPIYVGVCIAAVLVFVGGILVGYTRQQRKRIISGAALVAVFLSVAFYWPVELFAAGYTTLLSPEGIRATQERVVDVEQFRSYTDTVNILTFADGTEVLTHNGYLSMSFLPNGDINTLLEMIVGTTPGLFNKTGDTALVLGLGTGVTAGATTQLAKDTRIVEVNTAMRDIIPRFSDKNFDVQNQPGAHIVIGDGITDLITNTQTYDYIVNTVSSPTYYSASKLWTKEVLELMSDRLAPGGVYSGWFDVRIGKTGMQSQMKTTAAVFEHCVYVLLNQGYFNTICSNEPLTHNPPAQNEWPEPLRGQFARHGVDDISAFLTDITINPDADLYNAGDIPLNTLDRPVLEFTNPVPYGYAARDASEFIGTFASYGFRHDAAGTALAEASLERKCGHWDILMPAAAYINVWMHDSFSYYKHCKPEN